MENEAYINLYNIASRAREKAYSPYSGVTVGAAILSKSGAIYSGANIENSSFGATICAERVALSLAIMAGERDFAAIAIAGGKCGGDSVPDFTPCGICRQVLSEFTDGELTVVTMGKDGLIVRHLSELLPFAFGAKKLDTGVD